MRVTLFWYMRVSPFLNFPVVDRVTLGGAKRVGPAPKCRRSAFWEGPERSLHGVLCRGSQTCFGRNRDPEGARNAKQKTECRRAPERPRSCDRARDGIHNGRHAPEQSCHLHTGCGSSHQLQWDSSWHVRRRMGAIRHRSCASKGSWSPVPPCTETGWASHLDWQQKWTSLSLWEFRSI